MSESPFDVPIPQEELDYKPSALMPAGNYDTTLQSGTELVSNDNGWQGIRVPFQGFTSQKDPSVNFEKERRMQITVESSNAEARRIGHTQLTALGRSLGLTEETQTGDGKRAFRITATSYAEFVEQVNAMAGAKVPVYVKTQKRKRDGQVVMKDDGSGPVMDNEISRVLSPEDAR